MLSFFYQPFGSKGVLTNMFAMMSRMLCMSTVQRTAAGKLFEEINIRVDRETPELAIPKATPCASMICQYFVQRPSMQIAKIARTEKGMLIRRAP